MSLRDLLKKKKKIEVIDMSHFNKSHIFEDDELKVEDDPVVEETVGVNDYQPVKSYSALVNEYNASLKNYDAVIREYYICKIFSRVDLNDVEFNEQVKEVDKYISDFKKLKVDGARYIDAYNRECVKDYDEEKRISMTLESYITADKIIMQRLKDINNNYYGQLNLSTVSACLSKNNNELENMYNLISEIVASHNTMDEAASNIYYKSGDFIVMMIKELVECIKLTNSNDLIEKFNYNYFLSSDVVLTLSKEEWIDLFNKVKLVMRMINGIDISKYNRFKEKFDRFEASYTIIMMKSEMNKR